MITDVPALLMLIGIPGCGKSSWIAKRRQLDFKIVSPDLIRKTISGCVSDQTLNVDVWKVAKRMTIESLESNKSVLLDATNVNTKYRRDFLVGLPPCNLWAKIFEETPEICYSRIANDIKNGKDRANVPEEVVYRMYGELLYTKKVIESEGFKILDTFLKEDISK